MNNPPQENIYGHIKRLRWIISHIKKSDRIIEFGCGTGYMITFPLRKMGYDIIGVDIDKKSIAYGGEIFQKEGLDLNNLKDVDIASLDITADVIIASEVLEHIPSEEMDETLEMLYSKLRPGGKILVTVPNGFGWFELESFLWNRLCLGKLFEMFKITTCLLLLKQAVFGKYIDAIYLSTLSPSPHLQRFTLHRIQKKLIEHGFEVIESKGSVLFCGSFSNILFTGIKPIMKINLFLGDKMPSIASGFYVAAIKRDA